MDKKKEESKSQVEKHRNSKRQRGKNREMNRNKDRKKRRQRVTKTGIQTQIDRWRERDKINGMRKKISKSKQSV